MREHWNLQAVSGCYPGGFSSSMPTDFQTKMSERAWDVVKRDGV